MRLSTEDLKDSRLAAGCWRRRLYSRVPHKGAGGFFCIMWWTLLNRPTGCLVASPGQDSTFLEKGRLALQDEADHLKMQLDFFKVPWVEFHLNLDFVGFRQKFLKFTFLNRF